MIENKKLIKALETEDIMMLRELQRDGYDFTDVSLSEIIEKGTNEEVVDFLINNGVDINAQDANDYTPLVHAIKDGNIKIVQLFIGNGVDLNAELGVLDTYIGYAVQEKEYEILKLLLKNGAEINDSMSEIRIFCLLDETFDERTIEILLLHGADILEFLDSAISGDNYKLVKYFLDNDISADMKIENKKTLLLHAVSNSAIKTVKLLIEYGATIDMFANDGVTDLTLLIIKIYDHDVNLDISKNRLNTNDSDTLDDTFESIDRDNAKNDIEIAKYLIEHGASVNMQTNGYPMFFFLIKKGLFDLIKLMIAHGLNINMISEDGQTALLTAIMHNETKIAKLLIKNGADINKKYKGFSPLFAASELGHKNIVKLLIKNGADLNAYSKDGLTALTQAIVKKHTNIVELLISKGADINALHKGMSALLVATATSQFEIVQLLLKKGADIDQRSKNGATPLMLASESGSIEIVKLLIKNDVDIDAKDEKDKTALMYAVRNNRTHITKYLLKNEVDINAKDKSGSTVLDLAAIAGNAKLVKFLIQNGADVANIDRDGNSIVIEIVPFLLMLNEEMIEKMRINKSVSSYKKDILKIIRLLLNAGADVNQESNEGYTALLFALIYKNKDLIEFLIENGADVNHINIQGMNPMMMTFMPPGMMKYMTKNANVFQEMMKKNDLLNFDHIITENNSLEISNLLIRNGAILDKFPAWTFNLMTQNIEHVKFIIEHSNVDDYENYMEALIVLSSYGPEEIFLKNIEDIAQKELYAQMIQKISPEMYLKIFELLVDTEVDLNAINDYGHTFLMSAVIHNNIAIVSALLKHNADVDLKSKTGFNVIAYAINNKEIRTALFKNGAKLNKEKFDQKSLKKIQKEINKTINEETDVGDVSWSDDEINTFLGGGSLLSNALESKKVKDLKKATIKGANLDVVDIVDLVLKGYGAKFIDTTLKYGIDRDRRDDQGQTALMHACSLGKKKVVEILIKNGAIIDIEDNDGNNVWYHASLSDKEEIVELLRNYDELSAPNHNPKELVKILTNFTKDTPIKYTTHNWDFGKISKTEHKNFQGFIAAIRKQWNKLEDDLYELSPNLHTKIYTFLLNDNKEADSWCEKTNISIGWSSLEGLEKWCDDGKDPYKFQLETSYIVDNKEISTFEDVINLFKQEIENRKEHHMLKKYFIDMKKSLDEHFTITFENFREDKFYTDIEKFKLALTNIFSEIKKRDFPQIIVSATNDTEGQYIDISIVQRGSVAQQSSDSMLKEVESGNFQSIKHLLANLCDWSVESSFDAENYRINYLRSDKNIQEIELLDYNPDGFTYKLRFYKA